MSRTVYSTGIYCNCRKPSGMLISHQPLVMSLWHMQSSPHVRLFPRRPQLRVHHHHVVHFPCFMQFIDNRLRAYSSSICAPHPAHALSWACPISHTPCFSLREFWHQHLVPPVPHTAVIFSFSVLHGLDMEWRPKMLYLPVILAAHYEISPSCLRRTQSSFVDLTRKHQVWNGFTVCSGHKNVPLWSTAVVACGGQVRQTRLCSPVLHWTVTFGGKASAIKTRKREKEACSTSNW